MLKLLYKRESRMSIESLGCICGVRPGAVPRDSFTPDSKSGLELDNSAARRSYVDTWHCEWFMYQHGSKNRGLSIEFGISGLSGCCFWPSLIARQE